jgi:hypothetical protein
MKNTLILILALSAVSAFAIPTPSPEQMRENYKTCLNISDTFYLRWGRYLVGYTYNEASNKCAQQTTYGTSTPKLMACKSNQGWLVAGYYCEDIPNLFL